MNKYEQLKKEISYIKNSRYRENAIKLVELLPDYFFTVAASSTGKYHPSYAQGNGGLLRHTKVAVRIAHELLNSEIVGAKYSDDEKDIITIALIMHDGLKHGIPMNKYVQADHPLLAANFIKDHKDEVDFTDNELSALCNMIESHMGEYNKDYNGNEILPVPINKYQKFVHMCDLLASKKFLEVPFDGNEILY